MNLLKTGKIAIFIVFLITLYIVWRNLNFDHKVYINADAYGYMYPAFAWESSEQLKLIYARPFFWPLVLALYPFRELEKASIIINSLMLSSLILPLLMLALDSINIANSRFKKICICLTLVVAIFLIYDNVNVTQWFHYILPEAFAITASCWIVYLTYAIRMRQVPLSFSFIVALLCSLLLYSKPSYTAFAYFGILVQLAEIAVDKKKPSWKIGFASLIIMPVVLCSIVNSVLVAKYDSSGSDRFKYGTLICFNMPAIVSQIEAKKNKDWIDISIQKRLSDVMARGTVGVYLNLGFNPDECLYSSELNLYQDLDAELGWANTPKALKSYVNYILMEPCYLFNKMIDQMVIVFKAPIYNSKVIEIEDISVYDFNRSGLLNDASDFFWNNHDWEKKKILKSFLSYNLYWVYSALLLFLIILNCAQNKETLFSNLIILGLLLSGMIVVTIGGSFDIARYRDVLIPLFVYFMYILILQTLSNSSANHACKS